VSEIIIIIIIIIEGKAIPVTGRGDPQGLRDVEARIFSRQLAHKWRGSCQP
jgi:hypothetical protein